MTAAHALSLALASPNSEKALFYKRLYAVLVAPKKV
jgi:hypothetical protein